MLTDGPQSCILSQRIDSCVKFTDMPRSRVQLQAVFSRLLSLSIKSTKVLQSQSLFTDMVHTDMPQSCVKFMDIPQFSLHTPVFYSKDKVQIYVQLIQLLSHACVKAEQCVILSLFSLERTVQSYINNNFTHQDHPRTVLPQLCRKFYSQGWMSGTGGALSVRSGLAFILNINQDSKCRQSNVVFILVRFTFSFVKRQV